MKGFNAPVIEMKAPAAMKGMNFRIQVSVMDCLGCGNCADVCPGNPKLGKALTMVPLEQELAEAPNWEYCVKNVKSKQDLVDIKSNVKNSQFAQPLFEFSGACAGCGETPYVKLISQLFGDREIVANATGCSSIYSLYDQRQGSRSGMGKLLVRGLLRIRPRYGIGQQEDACTYRRTPQGCHCSR